MKRSHEKMRDPVADEACEELGEIKSMRGGKDQDLDTVSALERYTSLPENDWSDCGLRLVRNAREKAC